MNASARVTVLDVLGNGGIFSKNLTGYEERAQQIATANLAARGIAERRHVIAELGTGGGKSHAVMVPAILSGERVVYTTAVKALQEQIADKDAPFLAAVLEPVLGRTIRYTVLKGRGNYVCLRNADKLERGGDFRSAESAYAFRELSDWIGQQRVSEGVADIETYDGTMTADLRMDVVTSTDECTGQRCPFFKDCFAERAKARAKSADLVIVNHKLACVDAKIRQESGSQAAIIPDYSLMIADEIHQLESIIRDTAGFEVTPARIRRLGWLLQKLTISHGVIEEYVDGTAEKVEAQKWADAQDLLLQRVDQYLAALKDRLERNEDVREVRLGDERPVRIGDEPLPGMDDDRPTILDVATALIKFGDLMMDGTPTWLEGEDRDAWGKVSEQTVKLGSDLATIVSPTSEGTWVRRAALDGENGKTRVVLDAKPVDVAPIGRSWFFGGTAKQRATMKDGTPVEAVPPLVVIGLSATISSDGNMDMIRERLGIDDAHEIVAGSPFNYRDNSLMYLPGSPRDLEPVQKRDRERWERYVSNLCAEMRGLTLDARGGAFLLFTSRSMMNEVYSRIADDFRAAGLTVLRQGDASRNVMMAEFKASGNAVLFGVKTFWEGVDVQGDALRLVAIDKIPFNPPTDVLWAALCDHIDRQHGERASFGLLSIPTAIIALKQGVGRLIRSKTDRGVVAILDGRIRLKAYGQRIIRNLPDSTLTSDPRDVQRLYAAMRAGSAPAPVAPVRTRWEPAPVSPQPAPSAAPAPRFRRLADSPSVPTRFRRLGQGR